MKSRALVLAACGIVTLTVVVLAPALRSLSFEPARAVVRAPDGPRLEVLPGFGTLADTSVGQILLAWLAVVLPILLAVLLLPPELRKRVFQQLTRFALFVLAFLLALRYRLIHLPDVLGAEADSGQTAFQTFGAAEEPATFIAPVLPPWLIYIISFLLFAAAALGSYALYRVWKRYRAGRTSSLGMIAAVARTSLGELAAGRLWGDVVIEAYARMTDVVRQARGVYRQTSWTPREFAERLGRNGLPASAVDELTRLFEAARYGGVTADSSATIRATACLESILQACGAAA